MALELQSVLRKQGLELSYRAIIGDDVMSTFKAWNNSCNSVVQAEIGISLCKYFM